MLNCVASKEVEKRFVVDNAKAATENSNNSIASNTIRDARSRLKPVQRSGSPSKKKSATEQQREEIEDRGNAVSANETNVAHKPVTEGIRPPKDATLPATEAAVPSESKAINGNAKSPPMKPTAADVESTKFTPSPPLPSRTSPQRDTGSSRTVEHATGGCGDQNGAVEAKKFARPPALPSRAKQHSPSPHRDTGTASSRNVEPATEGSGDPSGAVESKKFALAPALPSRTRQPSPSPQRNAGTLECKSDGSEDKAKAPAVVGSDNGSMVDNRRQLPLTDSSQRTVAVNESTPTRLTDIKRSGMLPLQIIYFIFHIKIYTALRHRTYNQAVKESACEGIDR